MRYDTAFLHICQDMIAVQQFFVIFFSLLFGLFFFVCVFSGDVGEVLVDTVG